MTHARGLLLVHCDPEPTLEDELNAWYDTEHLPERAAIAGFETALRFTSLGDGPRYLAIYDLAGLDVLESPAYLAVSGPNFSPWTKRVTSRARPVRMTARQIATQAGTVACTRLLLLQFDATGKDAAAIEAGLQASFGDHPALLQSRLFEGAEPAPDFMLAICSFAGPAIPSLDMGAFGHVARRLTLAAGYRPYRG
jgi:hypothetical protein